MRTIKEKTDSCFGYMKPFPVIPVLCLLLTGSFASLQAQEKIDKEVYVVKPYEPTLSDAYKISQMPVIDDTTRIVTEFNYSVAGRKLSPDAQVAPIPAARMMPEPAPRLYKTYLKMGMGTYITPLFQLNVNSIKPGKQAFGLAVDHLSSHGNIKLENGRKGYGGFANSGAALYGKTWVKNLVLSGDLGVKSSTVYHYGSSLDTVLEKGDIRQNFLTIMPSFSLKTMKVDSSRLNVNIQGNYNYTHESGGEYENGFCLNGTFNKRYNKNWLGFDAGIHYRKPSDGIDSTYTTVLSLAPWFNRHSAEWTFVAGFTTAVDVVGGNSNFRLYPKLQLEFQVVPSKLVAYFGADGRTVVHDYYAVVEENPYIVPTLSIKNTNEKINAYAGVRGSAGDFSFNASAGYSMLDDLPFFVNDTVNGLQNQFSVLYDDAELTTFSGELGYQMNSKIEMKLRGHYYNYSLSSLDHPYQKPPFDLSLIAVYNLKDKIIGRLETYLLGQQYVRTSALSPDNMSPDKLKAFVDFNLGLEYRYTKVMSFFITCNNFTATRYEIWNHYPVQRFRLMFGFTYAL